MTLSIIRDSFDVFSTTQTFIVANALNQIQVNPAQIPECPFLASAVDEDISSPLQDGKTFDDIFVFVLEEKG